MQSADLSSPVRALGLLEGARLIYRALRPYRVRAATSLAFTALGIGLEAIALVSLVPFFELLTRGDDATVSRGGVFAIVETILGWVGAGYTVTSLMAIIAGLFLLKALVTIAGEIARISVHTDYEQDMRTMTIANMLAARWDHVRDRGSGSLINTMLYQIARGSGAVSGSLTLLSQAVTIAVYTFFALIVSPVATVILIAILGVTGSVTLWVFRAVTVYAGQGVVLGNRITQRFNDMISGFKIIKAMAVEGAINAKVRDVTREIKRVGMRSAIIRAIFASALEPGIIIALVAILLIRSWGIAGLGEAGVIGLLLFRAFQRVYAASVALTSVADNLPSLRTVALMNDDASAHRERTDGREAPALKTLELRDVSFEYEEASPVLVDINLRVERGEFVGIVGASGAGKSTLVDLLLGLISPMTGSILINDVSLGQMSWQSWRRHIGYVPQETVLFNDTIANNLAMGRSELSKEDIVWAAHIAQAADFIEALPAAYESPVGERGVKLSGGERQRLALARAIASKPEILILDEATSSLDSKAERAFQDALEGLRDRFTIIAVAHRLSTVLDADRILVIDRGTIVESGRPSELLAEADGRFRKLYEVQIGRLSDQVPAGSVGSSSA